MQPQGVWDSLNLFLREKYCFTVGLHCTYPSHQLCLTPAQELLRCPSRPLALQITQFSAELAQLVTVQLKVSL